MTHKIIITKPTYNALTETNPENMIFSSDYNTLKYHVKGSLVINVSEDPNTVYSYTTYFTHNLGYFPFHIIYVKYGTNWEMIGTNYLTGFWDTTYIYRKFEGWVTKNRIYVKVSGQTGTDVSDSYSADFRYRLFKNNLDL